ncbi:hypothetical protein DPEC_G00187530 [Dallia pectoralis]|uniref:Uncharacterized protein n=1 Tax=Dallia pectoralis TaxID=75939 RepID=A0ACC2GBV1_DALPE|nr:hypothetical protein DPEC_G00187530 [Dallia pectoralis]
MRSMLRTTLGLSETETTELRVLSVLIPVLCLINCRHCTTQPTPGSSSPKMLPSPTGPCQTAAWSLVWAPAS